MKECCMSQYFICTGQLLIKKEKKKEKHSDGDTWNFKFFDIPFKHLKIGGEIDYV